jgi:hypothetical protein
LLISPYFTTPSISLMTAGDVLGLGGLSRNLREHVTRLHFVAILHHQVRAGGHQVLLACAAG